MTNALTIKGELGEARIEAEEALLGAILIESAARGIKEAVNTVRFIVKPEDFFGYLASQPLARQPQRVRIYKAMLEADDPPNQICVAYSLHSLNALLPGDCSYLCHCVAVCPSSMDYEYYAKVVKSYSKKINSAHPEIGTHGTSSPSYKNIR